LFQIRLYTTIEHSSDKSAIKQYSGCHSGAAIRAHKKDHDSNSLTINNVVARSAHNHLWLILVSAVYVLASWYVVAHTPQAHFDTSLNSLIWIGVAAPLSIGLLLSVCFRVVVIQHPPRPLRHLWTEARALIDKQQIASGLLVLFLLSPMIFYFSQIKSLIPYLNPQDWDTTFARLDTWIAGGRHPYEYLDALLNWPWLYRLLSHFYHDLWVVVCFGVIAHVAFATRESFEKSRFLLSYFLCWILIGSVFAIAFNSGGPIFFHDYTSLGTYDPLVAQLRRLAGSDETGAYGLAQMLAGFRSPIVAPPPGMGISAMPSMHVSMAFLVFLHFRKKTRFARVLVTLFAGMIFVLSVALGWHYVVDGLAAILLTTGIWWLAGWMVRSQPVRY